jgi:hypothetical protein
MAAVRPHVNSAASAPGSAGPTLCSADTLTAHGTGPTAAKLPVAQFGRKGRQRDDPPAPDFRTAIGSMSAQRRASRHTFGKDFSHVGVA